MSFGRIPELLLAGLIMGALLMVWLWTKTSETKARRVFLEEVAEDWRRTGRLEVPANLFSAGAPTPPPTGRSVEDRLRRLYPNYAGRLTLIRLRLHRIEQIVWIRSDAGRGVQPLGLLLLPALAEALRRRARKLASPIAFPNEIVFHLGLWLTVWGTAGLVIGYLLAPVPIPPGLFLMALTVLLTVGLIAIIANVPGRWRHDG